MRLMIIRHGDPDYEHDSLTPKGWQEARLLSERLEKLKAEKRGEIHCYMSPLGRAQDTASLTLEKLGKEAVVYPWLREFDAPVIDPETGERRLCWDFLPASWMSEEMNFDRLRWSTTAVMESGNVQSEADRVWNGIDGILAAHGYVRSGNLYRAEHASEDTILIFCHFGVECVMLAHILNISPMILWHNFCAAPSSVTTLYSEERIRGTASFRMSAFGDISHLYAAGETPSFAARFCETYDNFLERH